MLDIRKCSYKPEDQNIARLQAARYLNEFESMLEYEVLDELKGLAGLDDDTKLEKIFDEGSENVMYLASGLRKIAGDVDGRMIVLWALACSGHETARTHLLRGLRASRDVIKSPDKSKYLTEVLELWDDLEEAESEPDIGRCQEKYIVLKAIGDDRSKEGKEISARYGSIINTPLRGGGELGEISKHYADLVEEYPWAENAIGTVMGQLALHQEMLPDQDHVSLPPILLEGKPGSGKTRFLTDLYARLKLPYSLLACGGTADSGGLLPVARGWATSNACGPAKAMLEHQCFNPGIVLDEIDKASKEGSRNGSMTGALLGMINGDRPYWDTCLMADIDLSRVNFSATANDISEIPDALLDRFMVIQMPSPTVDHFDSIIQGVIRDEARRLRVPVDNMPPLENWELDTLRDVLESTDSSIRRVQRTYRIILGKNALKKTTNIDKKTDFSFLMG